MENVSRKVRIITSKADGTTDVGHHFATGTVVDLKKIYPGEGREGADLFEASGPHCNTGDTITQIFWASDFEEIVEVVKEPVEMNGKLLYAVVKKYSDGYEGIIETMEDRDEARHLKAILGGKKDGVRIVSYAPVKEIR